MSIYLFDYQVVIDPDQKSKITEMQSGDKESRRKAYELLFICVSYKSDPVAIKELVKLIEKCK